MATSTIELKNGITATLDDDGGWGSDEPTLERLLNSNFGPDYEPDGYYPLRRPVVAEAAAAAFGAKVSHDEVDEDDGLPPGTVY